MKGNRPLSLTWLSCCIMLLLAAPPAYAQQGNRASAAQPANVREFLSLLEQPDVQQWLKSQAAPTTVTDKTASETVGVAGFFATRLAQIRNRVALVVDGVMNVGTTISEVSARIADEMSANGTIRTILQLISLPLFAAIGTIAFKRFSRSSESRPSTSGPGRFPSPAGLAGFTIGCLLPLLMFSWTDILKQAVVVIVLALAGIRLTIFIGRVCVKALARGPAAGEPENDLVDRQFARTSSPALARHWYVSSIGLVSYFLVGWALVELAGLFGVAGGAMLLLVYVLAFGLFAIALWAVWTRPEPEGSRHHAGMSWLWTVALAVLLFFWLAGFHALLWIGIFALTLPFVLPFCSKVVRSLLNSSDEEERLSVSQTIFLDRGLRAVVVAIAAWWLARILGLEATGMASGQTIGDRVARGLLQGVVVVLVADLFWALAKAQIETRLQSASDTSVRSDAEKSRASRLMTLLPILRNVLAAVIGIVSILMVLSGLGVEIAPLLAGAGVVGVAVGFGAQTVVKDVISGMFYLWDDAFRIGEYIETGKYKGTVESFSLRSVKLRHHRGPLTTVPFGELGAVQNMSRDWSVTKFNLRVGYDTDLDKLRKVIKKIGEELANREEYRDNIISPLKMKGVVEFGEYAIEVRVGFTTKPGEQFMIRRDAMTMIRLAFKENGIHFAVPTVQVSNSEEGEATDAAVAQMQRAREQRKQMEVTASAGG